MSKHCLILIYVQVMVILLALFSLHTLKTELRVVTSLLKMISILGVSKAVLDNVIFCHQEESNWSVTSVSNIIFLLYCFLLDCIKLPHYNALHCVILP